MLSLQFLAQRVGVLLFTITVLAGCARGTPQDVTGPTIEKIATSSKVLAKSDCIPTSLTITAEVKDDRQVADVAVWYRIGADQMFSTMKMKAVTGNQYDAQIIALNIPGGEYGTLEFYILAHDAAGNETKSAVDKSVQLLACVAS